MGELNDECVDELGGLGGMLAQVIRCSVITSEAIFQPNCH